MILCMAAYGLSVAPDVGNHLLRTNANHLGHLLVCMIHGTLSNWPNKEINTHRMDGRPNMLTSPSYYDVIASKSRITQAATQIDNAAAVHQRRTSFICGWSILYAMTCGRHIKVNTQIFVWRLMKLFDMIRVFSNTRNWYKHSYWLGGFSLTNKPNVFHVPYINMNNVHMLNMQSRAMFSQSFDYILSIYFRLCRNLTVFTALF